MLGSKLIRPAGILAGLALLAAGAAAQTKSATPQPKTETGYVVSVGETAMVISNIEPGSGGGSGAGAGGGGNFEVRLGPGDVIRGADGKASLSADARKRFTPQQAKMIEEDLNNASRSGQGRQVISRRTGPGEGGGTEVRIGPGDVVHGADGKRSLTEEAKKRLTPEQVKRIEEDLNNPEQSGSTVIRRSSGEGPGGGQGGTQARTERPASPSVPLQLTDFVLDKKTKSAKDLGRGDKVKVTYVEADGKKVATRIERVK